MKIIVEVKNEILGDHVFWTGDEHGIATIRNMVAKQLAEKVSQDGKSRSDGMWYVRADPDIKNRYVNCTDENCDIAEHAFIAKSGVLPNIKTDWPAVQIRVDEQLNVYKDKE